LAFTAEFADFVIGQMAGIGPVTRKRMFASCGLFSHGLMFALISDDVLYLKASGALADELAALGSTQFGYSSKTGKRVDLPYWRAPEDCLENPDEMVAWGKKSLAALSSQAAKKPTAPRKRSKAS
jgi:DNA transformation protein